MLDERINIENIRLISLELSINAALIQFFSKKTYEMRDVKYKPLYTMYKYVEIVYT